MRTAVLSVLVILSALLQLRCGPDPIDVSGPWAGAHNLMITGSQTASGTEGISVSQNGRDISFHFSGCEVKAAASGEQTFDIYDFQCTRLVNQRTWKLWGDGKSKISAGPSTFNMTISGDAESDPDKASFTWTFNGSRQ